MKSILLEGFSSLSTRSDTIIVNPMYTKETYHESVYKCHEPSKKKSTARSRNYLQFLEDKNVSEAHEVYWALLKTLSPFLRPDVPA